MLSKLNNKYVIVGVMLLVAFAAGRYSRPAKVEEQHTVAQAEDKNVKNNVDVKKDVTKDTHEITTTTETIKPDGTKQIVTVTKDDTSTAVKTDSKDKTQSDDKSLSVVSDSKSTTYQQGHLNVSVMAGASITSLGSTDYGLSISKNLLGPVTVGIWGLKSGTAGFSVGLDF